jgi:hypothetical protein
MATVLDLIWVGWQQIFFGKSEIKDSTALPPDGQITSVPTALGCIRIANVIARSDLPP